MLQKRLPAGSLFCIHLLFKMVMFWLRYSVVGRIGFDLMYFCKDIDIFYLKVYI
jgi:hypothetical protein